MENLRSSLPQELGGKKVVFFRDFEKPAADGLPLSDVLLFRLEDQSQIIIRPSGTEPKIKVYLSVTDKMSAACQKRIEQLAQTLKAELRGTSV